MKTTTKVLLSCLLLGGSFTCFAQQTPSNEFVNHIPPGRNILVQPMITKAANASGRVVIDFVIDTKGNVTSAHANRAQTTVTDTALVHKCEKAVKAAKFSALKTAPEAQHGSLAFAFKH